MYPWQKLYSRGQTGSEHTTKMIDLLFFICNGPLHLRNNTPAGTLRDTKHYCRMLWYWGNLLMQCITGLTCVVSVWNVVSLTAAAVTLLDFPTAIWAGWIFITTPWHQTLTSHQAVLVNKGTKDVKYVLFFLYILTRNPNWSDWE